MKNIILAFILLTGIALAGIAQEPAVPAVGVQGPVVFTLEQSIRYGLEHSTTARRARLEEDIAHTQVGQAGSLALPQLTLDAGYTRLDEVQKIDFGDVSQDVGTLDNYDVTAGVSQLLYSGGQVGAALRAARLAREHADAARRTTNAGLIRDIEMQFYGLLLVEASVAVQAASVDQLRAYAEQTRLRKENGAVSEFELLTAQVRLANELPKLIEARNSCELARAAFATLLNHPDGLTVTGVLEQASIDLDLEEMELLAFQNRQEIRSSDIRLGLGQEAIVSARSEGRPSVRAFFNYNGANAYQFVSYQGDWQWHWNAGLTLNWSLWDGNLTRQTVRQKQFEYEQFMADDEAVREGVKLEVRQAYLGLVHAREAIVASGDSVELAERALDIARTRYESGLSTYIEFTDANLALSTARLARLKAQHDHAVAMSRVNYACGLK